MIEIFTVGGYSEVGRNMTVVKYKDEAVILDMGVHLERYIKFKGDDELELFSYNDLKKAEAVPDDTCIKEFRKKVLAIIPSHAHLDHIGAIPYMAQRYDCPIICSNYTEAVITAILEDKQMTIPNEIKILEKNRKLRLSDSITIELINITHSIPDATLVVIHTPDGQVIYTNDFKFDDTPVIGEPPNYNRLKELGKEGHVKLLLIDSIYADQERKTPSEMIAKEMLKKVMLETKANKNAIIVTTFSSHIARLKSIIEFGKILKRKIVFLGRSLGKYVYAAEKVGIVDFSSDAKIISYKSQIAKILKKIEKEGREKYLIVATGHQGEPDAVLSKIANDKFSFKLMSDDVVIFSCNTIPSPLNIANREILEKKLKEKDIRMFKEIHQSGHASREDHRNMINMVKPEHIIPSHVGKDKAELMVNLTEQLGYKRGKTVHVMDDEKKLEI